MFRGRAPPKPESESEWDSDTEVPSVAHSARIDTAPKIEMSSADERPAKNTPSKTTNQKSTKPKGKENISQRLQVDEDVSSKQNTPKSVRARNNNVKKTDPLSTFTFTDRSSRNDEESPRQPSKREVPPYDFKAALTDHTQSGAERTPKPLGKDRKGALYDPAPPGQDSADEAEDIDSWDDTEAPTGRQDKVNQNMLKPTPPPTARSEVKDGEPEELQKSGSSWRNMRFLGQKNKTKESPRHKPMVSQSNEQLIKEDSPGLQVTDEGKQTKPSAGKDSGEQQDAYALHVSRYVYHYEEGQQEFSEAHQERTRAKMTQIADKAETILTRLWQEVFAALRLIMLVVTTFVIQLVKFVTRDIFQTLVVGLLVVIGDHVIKPLLSALYNGFLQPVMVLLWNILHGLKNALQPLYVILRGIFQQLAHFDWWKLTGKQTPTNWSPQYKKFRQNLTWKFFTS